MKKIRLLTLLGVILVAGTLVGCGNKDKEGDFIIEDITGQNDAVIEYNDTLVDLTAQCLSAEDDVWSAYNNSDTGISNITNAINNLVNECSTAGEQIKKLGDREGDDSLKNGVLNVIEKEISYYIKFNELLPFIRKEGLTEEESANYNSIYEEIESIDIELNKANEDLSIIQEQFAENHGFELEEETTAE